MPDTPADKLREAAFQLRNPFHLPGLRAAIDPDLAYPLADWLDQAAHAYDAAVYAANEVYRDDPAGRDAFLTTGPGAPSPHSLHIAHTINQETT